MQLSKELAKDTLQWDVVNWSKALKLWNQKIPNAFSTGLAIGDRHGGLSVFLAEHGASKVICSDIDEPTNVASTLIDKYGLQNVVECKTEDMTQLSFEDNSVDVICFKSVLGAIRGSKDDQATAIKECYRVLKPGGIICFAENIKGSFLHKMARNLFIKWSDSWLYFDIKTDPVMFGSFSEFHLETYGVLGTFGRKESLRRFLSIFDPLLCWRKKSTQHYIAYGYAIK